MSAMVLPKEISQALVELTGEPREGMALVLLMRDYARHKLEEIDVALKQYEQKYEMPFEAFRQQWESEEQEEHYAYANEWDYMEWEALITRRKRLESSFAWLP